MTVTLPPDSILSNTAEILKACEMEEISGTLSSTSFYLVTQLASLLLLGRYSQARHLWRRYSTDIFPDAQMETSMITTKTGRDLDMYQFQLLWKAAHPLLQSYFGQLPLHTSNTEMFESLHLCVEANLYPLSLYAKELIEGIRNQMATLIETIYDSIQEAKCIALLGITDGQALDRFLSQRGWEKKVGSQVFWIPVSPEIQAPANNEQNSEIQLLSNVIGFMEKKNVQL